MKKNPGYRPPECVGRKVHVRLFSGYDTKKRMADPWPADAPTDWTISDPPHPAQIRGWELV